MATSAANIPITNSVHENIRFLYEEDCGSFQEGMLGNGESFLVGKLRLSYKTPCQIKSVYLRLEGVESTSWSILTQPPRKKVICKGGHTFLNESYKIGESKHPIT